MQELLDTRNLEFWNELCGTALARSLGIEDSSADSLRRFDEWYFAFYPYLADHIPFGELRGRRVLEVGLGYGTVAQRLAESGADYTGLDIAQGPVDMVNHRLEMHSLSGIARRGSILEAPFPDESFDCIVAIGCYHHTGDLQRALDESRRLLRRGGRLVAMVYNAYSYRRWVTYPGATARYLVSEITGSPRLAAASGTERGAYDHNAEGVEAPHTDFVSRRHLRRLCSRYSAFSAVLENINQERPFSRWRREALLRTKLPARCGLDIYFEARK